MSNLFRKKKKSKYPEMRSIKNKGRKQKSMKLSIFRNKIIILFVVLTLALIIVAMFYDKKNEDYQIYLNGNPTEYSSPEVEGLEQIQLSALKALDCFTYDDDTEQKTTIITPTNSCYTVDYVTKTITNKETLETFEGKFLGDTLDDVIVDIDDIVAMGDYETVIDEHDRILDIENTKEGTLSQKLIKQSQYPYFNYNLIDEYYGYLLTNPTMQSYDAIITVNEGLYRPFYEDTVVMEMPTGYDFLVNKYQALPSTYAPNDLVCESNGVNLRQEAFNAFADVRSALQEQGMNLYLHSGYRSYAYQDGLYNRYVNESGIEYADETSARPGFSEHQSGLGMDILSVPNVAIDLTNEHFENTEEYQWMLDNAYKYGLILRYPEGQEDVTGYVFEPWHWRYVGIDVATFMKENDIKTLEEFYALKGDSEEKFPELEKKEDTAEPVIQTLKLDDKTSDVLAYEINGIDYYNIESISQFVSGSKYQFKVIYEDTTNTINFIKSMSSVTSKDSTEYIDEEQDYTLSTSKLAVDNFGVDTTYNQYIINDEMYMSLVDLNKALGCNIHWDYVNNCFEF